MVLVLGAGLRLAWLQGWPTQPVSDFGWYFDRAVEISRGMGYQWEGRPTAYWPVGWPGFLGAIFALFGPNLLAAKLAQAALTWAAAPLAYVVARQWSGSRWAGVAAAAWCALHPVLIGYSSILASEPLFALLMLLALAFAARPGWAGAAWGLAAMVRPQAVLFLPCMLLLKLKNRRKALALMAAGCLLALSPWLARCVQTHGSLFLVSANGGENLLIGALGERYQRPDQLARDAKTPQDELRLDREARAEALSIISQDPFSWVAQAPAKLARTFGQSTDAAYWSAQTVPGQITEPRLAVDRGVYLAYRGWCEAFLWPFAALWLSAAGAAFLKNGQGPRAALAMLAIQALLAVLFFGGSRFAYPMIPLAGAAGAAGAALLAQRWVVKVVK